MEIYRVKYKQLSSVGREMHRIKSEFGPVGEDYNEKMTNLLVGEDCWSWPPGGAEQGRILAKFTSEYIGHKTLVVLPVPDISLIEETVRRFVTSKKDESHWFYITEIQYLGSALEFKAPESQEDKG